MERWRHGDTGAAADTITHPSMATDTGKYLLSTVSKRNYKRQEAEKYYSLLAIYLVLEKVLPIALVTIDN